MASDTIAVMEGKLRERIDDLKAIDRIQLGTMPEYSDAEIKAGKAVFTLATWTKHLEDDSIQVVVQAYRHVLLGMGTMLADGFVINKTGTVLPISEHVLFEYR